MVGMFAVVFRRSLRKPHPAGADGMLFVFVLILSRAEPLSRVSSHSGQ
jgi:hypothetical protein